MSTEIKERVVTEFEIADHATAPLGGLKASFSQVGSVLSETARNIFSLRSAITGVITGLAVGKIGAIGAEFENTQIQLAGFLQVQKMVKTFDDGLKEAAVDYKALNQAAAVLPGETQEYVGVFLQGFANVRAATQGSAKDIYTFTNKMTALGKTFQLDAGTIGRELTELLTPGHGRASAHNILWQRMLASMHQLHDGANITAESFNKMTETKRFDLLNRTVGQFDDMIQKSATTWDALTGTFKSNVKMMTRAATEELFGSMKMGLNNLNNLFVDADGNFTHLGQTVVTTGAKIGNSIINGTTRAIGALHHLYGVMRESQTFAELKFTAGQMAGGGLNMMHKTMDRAQYFGPEHGAVGMISAAIMPMLPLLHQLPIIGRFIPVFGTLGSVWLPIVIQGFVTLWHHTAQMSSIFQSVRGIVGRVADIFSEFSVLLGTAGNALGELATVVLPPLLNIVGDLADVLGTVLVPIIHTVAGALSGIADVARSIQRHQNADDEMRNNPDWRQRTNAEVDAAMEQWWNDHPKSVGNESFEAERQFRFGYIQSEAAQRSKVADYQVDQGQFLTTGLAIAKDAVDVAKASVPKTPPHRGGGGRAVQDFRYSRFEIQQKFAEGYDPDRVAVAFARDVGRVGEMKLQSSHEPLFATR